MILSLTLTNFRRHEHLHVDFTTGLNVIRGPNEVGKTTLIEAFLYAGGGVKALREPLVDTVTWGQKDSTLKVVAVTEFNGIRYTFSRSKSGAECNYEGGKVVGQAEVSAFFANLLGADPKTASLLMLASASGLRGALDDGPTAVSGLMGRLADFDIIDQIIETAANRFTLGSAVPIEEKLQAADIEASRYAAALSGHDPVPELNARIGAETEKLVGLQPHADDVLQPAIVTADEKVQHAKAQRQRQISLGHDVARAQEKLTTEQGRLVAAQAQAAKVPDAAAMAALRAQLADAAVRQRQVDAYASFKAIPKYPAEFWEGTKAAFDADRADLVARLASVRAAQAAAAAEIVGLNRGKITSGKCPTCGHAATSDEHVAAHNAEIAAKVQAVMAGAAPLTAQAADLAADVATFDSIEKAAKPFETAAAKLHEWVEVRADLWPPSVSWRGPAPAESVSSDALRRQLSALEAEANAAAVAQGRCQTHEVTIAELAAELAEVSKTLAAVVVPDLQPLVDAYDEAYRVYAEANTVIRGIKEVATALTVERDAAAAVRAEAQAKLSAAQARVAELTQDLKTLEFNNTLVAKLKKLKPMITDHLWNTVLAAVSNFFSSLRGEQSIVTKDSKGFKVNGRGIDGLSESTLDVLAIAIRVALTKTFIPHASFISLDEPAKGCDAIRTSSLLGFLSSMGLQQTVLASHDELSEAVADNVILLGA